MADFRSGSTRQLGTGDASTQCGGVEDSFAPPTFSPRSPSTDGQLLICITLWLFQESIMPPARSRLSEGTVITDIC